jgi:ketosteroid isomerase-like protein
VALQLSPELRDVFLRVNQALSRGDVSEILGLISQDEGVLSIGTDPEEWWRGFDKIKHIYTEQLAQMGDSGIQIEANDPECYVEGSVGWGSCNGRFIVPDGTSQSMRVTAVFRREGESWKIVQWHTSFGVRNEDVFGTNLPT